MSLYWLHNLELITQIFFTGSLHLYQVHCRKVIIKSPNSELNCFISVLICSELHVHLNKFYHISKVNEHQVQRKKCLHCYYQVSNQSQHDYHVPLFFLHPNFPLMFVSISFLSGFILLF